MILTKLKNHIETTGIKKTKIAEQLGITKEYLSYIINGKSPMTNNLEDKIRELIK